MTDFETKLHIEAHEHVETRAEARVYASNVLERSGDLQDLVAIFEEGDMDVSEFTDILKRRLKRLARDASFYEKHFRGDKS